VVEKTISQRNRQQPSYFACMTSENFAACPPGGYRVEMSYINKERTSSAGTLFVLTVITYVATNLISSCATSGWRRDVFRNLSQITQKKGLKKKEALAFTVVLE
jgi:hypothetical protein